MKKEFTATKIHHSATYESIEIEIGENEVSFLILRKLNNGKMVFNKVEIEKSEIMNFFKEHLK